MIDNATVAEQTTVSDASSLPSDGSAGGVCRAKQRPSVSFVCTDGAATVPLHRACNASLLLCNLIDTNTEVKGEVNSSSGAVALALPHPVTRDELVAVLQLRLVWMENDTQWLQRLIIVADALLCVEALKQLARQLQRCLRDDDGSVWLPKRKASLAANLPAVEPQPCLLPPAVLERCGQYLSVDDWPQAIVDDAIRVIGNSTAVATTPNEGMEDEPAPKDPALSKMSLCLLRHTARGIVFADDDGQRQLCLGHNTCVPLADYPFVDHVRRLTLLGSLTSDDVVAMQPILQRAETLHALLLPTEVLTTLLRLPLPALRYLKVVAARGSTFALLCREFRQAPCLRRIVYRGHLVECMGNNAQSIVDTFPNLEALELRNVFVTDGVLDLLAERLVNLSQFACQCGYRTPPLTEQGVERFLSRAGSRLTKFCLTGLPSSVLTLNVLLRIAALPRLRSLWLSLSFAPNQRFHSEGLRAIVANPLLCKFYVWQSPTAAGRDLFLKYPGTRELFGNPDLCLGP